MTFQLHHEQLSVFSESLVACDDGLDIVVVVVSDENDDGYSELKSVPQT